MYGTPRSETCPEKLARAVGLEVSYSQNLVPSLFSFLSLYFMVV